MSKERDISFPPGEIGKLHTEHGRTWKYVEPGMWKSVNTSGGSGDAWDDIKDKPTEFPPEPHGHVIGDVDGLQDALDNAGSAPAWDEVTGKPTEFPPESHTHDQYALSDDVDSEILRVNAEILNLDGEITTESATRKAEDDALGLRIDAIEDSVTDDGGFVDAPNDGKLYGRQSETWEEVVIPSGGASSWDDLTDKPTEFPPESHNHVVADITDFDPDDYQPKGDYQPAGDYIGEAANDGKLYGRQSGDWAEVVIPSTAWDDITSKPTEFPPSAHTHEIEDVNGLQDALNNAGGDSATYTLPVVLRSGAVQLPLTPDGAKLAVMTRGGELELPLAA